VKIHLHSPRAEEKGSTHASLPLPLTQHPTLPPWRVYLTAAAVAAAAVGWPCDVSDDVYDDPLHHAHMKMSWAWQSLVELPHSPTGLTVVELE